MNDFSPATDFEDLEACAAQRRPVRHHGPFKARVNDNYIRLPEPVPTGRQILDAAALHPADDHVLLLMRRDRMLVPINLDDPVDLRQHAPERFFAFRSDTTVYFDVDGRRFPWGEMSIPEPLMRYLGDIQADYGIWLEQKGQQDDLPIKPGSIVDLSGPHIHRFYSGSCETNAGRGALPQADAEYLADHDLPFELIEQPGQKALLLKGYTLPPGKYNVEKADILVLLPAGYPDVATDMFYANPWLTLAPGGRYPQCANLPQPFGGVNYQRWSRHNPAWRPGKDGIRTVMRRIEAAIRTAA